MLTRIDNKKRRFTDRLADKRQAVLEPDEPAVQVPQAWRDLATAIADLPDGAELNIAGMRAKARELLGALA